MIKEAQPIDGVHVTGVLLRACNKCALSPRSSLRFVRTLRMWKAFGYPVRDRLIVNLLRLTITALEAVWANQSSVQPLVHCARQFVPNFYRRSKCKANNRPGLSYKLGGRQLLHPQAA